MGGGQKEDEEGTDPRRSDVAERDLERPGSVRHVFPAANL